MITDAGALRTVHVATKRQPLGPSGVWELVFSDEFDGVSLDETKWNTRYRWSPRVINNELEYYTPDDVLLEHGCLRLRAQERQLGGQPYTSGVVASWNKYSFLYGVAEARFKVPKGKGLWPAFWLLPEDRPSPPEVDVMEIIGSDTTTAVLTFHHPALPEQDSTYCKGIDYAAGFHTFTLEWSSSEMIWYIDGVERKRYTDTATIPDVPMYLLLNLAVGGSWPGPPDQSTKFPAYYEIDHVRVWQH